jgi:hypothetical protein
MKSVLAVILFSALLLWASAADKQAGGVASPSPVASRETKWISFPDPRLELRGLPWFDENKPELWRLPKSARPRIPNGAWNRAVASDGARIRFSSSTSRLAIRVQVVTGQKKRAFFDAYVDDVFAGSASATAASPTDLVLFESRARDPRSITIYLPNTTEVRVLAVGVDPDADLSAARPFALKAPLVCYGSSVLQGTGAEHPSKTYPAVAARRLNLDFVNLGFGGAGKAEPAVVELVNQLDASAYIFDLGKSYGNQTKEPFVRMLATIRATHPTVPIFCVTPIYSTKEINEKEYREKSGTLRNMMRDAAADMQTRGDKNTYVVEGLELFGAADKALFRDPQHPNDEGNELMAQRLTPIIEGIVLRKK